MLHCYFTYDDFCHCLISLLLAYFPAYLDAQMSYNQPQAPQYVQSQPMYQHSGAQHAYPAMQLPMQHQPPPSNYSPYAPSAHYAPQQTQQSSPYRSYDAAAPASQSQYPPQAAPSYPSYPLSPTPSPLQNSSNNSVYVNSFDLANFVRTTGIADADASSFVQRATAEVR